MHSTAREHTRTFIIASTVRISSLSPEDGSPIARLESNIAGWVSSIEPQTGTMTDTIPTWMEQITITGQTMTLSIAPYFLLLE
jgi:hypothetical protein